VRNVTKFWFVEKMYFILVPYSSLTMFPFHALNGVQNEYIENIVNLDLHVNGTV